MTITTEKISCCQINRSLLFWIPYNQQLVVTHSKILLLVKQVLLLTEIGNVNLLRELSYVMLDYIRLECLSMLRSGYSKSICAAKSLFGCEGKETT